MCLLVPISSGGSNRSSVSELMVYPPAPALPPYFIADGFRYNGDESPLREDLLLPPLGPAFHLISCCMFLFGSRRLVSLQTIRPFSTS